MRRGVLLLTALVLLGAPGDASAATLSFTPAPGCPGGDKYMTCEGTTIRYAALPGEMNDVTLSLGTGSGVVLREAALPLAAPPGCRQLDERAVDCPATQSGLSLLTVSLGDGADTFAGRSVTRTVIDGGPGPDRLLRLGGLGSARGGAGDDLLVGNVGSSADGTTLSGGAGEDRLVGSRGSDRLFGGSGRDTLLGGSGDDDLSGDGDPDDGPDAASIAADLLDGGPGRDTVSYAERRVPIAVTLGAQDRGGSSGEGDVLRDIEGARGSRGDDVLVGDDASNQLHGDHGEDRLVGRGGNDRVSGGPGVDRIDAGAGDDIVELLLGGRPDRVLDRIVCGSGEDTVAVVADDLLRRDCERIGLESADFSLRAVPRTPRPRTATIRVPCRTWLTRDRCTGHIEIRRPGGGGVLGARRYAVRRPGGPVTVRLRASARGPLALRVTQRSNSTGRTKFDRRWRLTAASR
jgi:serralysin